MQCKADTPLPRLDFCRSWVDLLRERASIMGEKPVFIFLRGSGEQEACLTYQGLHERAMAIAGELQTLAATRRAGNAVVSARPGFHRRVLWLPLRGDHCRSRGDSQSQSH